MLNIKFKMSATVSTPVIVESECNALNLTPKELEKKVRVPTTLPAKYGKFIQFGYYLLNKLNAVEDEEDSSVPMVDEKLFLEKLRIYDTLENQQALVQEFFDSSKSINQNLRKMMIQNKREIAKALAAQNKPVKEKKTRQPRQKKEVVQEEGTVEQPKEKKTRVKKVKAPTTEDQLVNELVQLASQQDLPQQIVLQVEETTSAKKDSAKAAVSELVKTITPIPAEKPVPAKKEKVVKEKVVKEKVVKEKVVKEKVVKEKVVKESKVTEESKESKEKESKVTTDTVTPTEDDEELHVSVFEYNLQKYLIDDQNNVYDFQSQDIIGSLNNGQLILN